MQHLQTIKIASICLCVDIQRYIQNRYIEDTRNMRVYICYQQA